VSPHVQDQVEQVVERTESRLAAWWSAWKWVAILGLLLVLSIAGNVHQYGTARAAQATCRTNMVAAAKAGIELERDRAAKAERQAQGIAQESKDKAAADARGAQENTNGREKKIHTVLVHGDCRMPVGLPSLQPAVDEANAPARF
jgi:hypothetical protein